MSDLPNTDQDLGALKEQIKTLQAKVAALENKGRKTAIPEHQSAEREVRVVEALPASTFKMPSDAELEKLLAAVARSHPSLVATNNAAFSGDVDERRQQYRELFEGAFLAMA
jgi:hypothetical protein